MLVDPDSGVARDAAWRNACWETAARCRLRADLAADRDSDIWIACGRSVAGVAVEAGRRAAVEQLLGATPLALLDGDLTTLVYAAGEPILCARSGPLAVHGMASRIPAYCRDRSLEWVGPSPLDVDVGALPPISNSQVLALMTAFRPDGEADGGQGQTLNLDRSFLVEQLSSRKQVAKLLLTRLGRGKRAARRIFHADRTNVPDSSCGLFLGPPVQKPARKQVAAKGWRGFFSLAASSQAELARRTAANGYSVLAIRPVSKDPADKPHWRRRCLDRPPASALESWDADFAQAGLGLACGRFVAAVDIDSKDPRRAAAIAGIAREILGETPLVRAGRGARLAMIYRCAEPIVTTRWRDLEVLGLGTQILAYGIHPRTGKPYRWIGQGEPATVPLEDLPTIGMADVDRLMRSVAAHYGMQAEPRFGPDVRNVMPIVTSLVSISRLLFLGLARGRARRREAAMRLLDGKYAGTGSGLAIEWRDKNQSG